MILTVFAPEVADSPGGEGSRNAVLATPLIRLWNQAAPAQGEVAGSAQPAAVASGPLQDCLEAQDQAEGSAEAAAPDPDPRTARDITLEEAGVILERLAALPRTNGRSDP